MTLRPATKAGRRYDRSDVNGYMDGLSDRGRNLIKVLLFIGERCSRGFDFSTLAGRIVVSEHSLKSVSKMDASFNRFCSYDFGSESCVDC